MILGYSFTCSILKFALFLNIKLMLSVKSYFKRYKILYYKVNIKK